MPPVKSPKEETAKGGQSFNTATDFSGSPYLRQMGTTMGSGLGAYSYGLGQGASIPSNNASAFGAYSYGGGNGVPIASANAQAASRAMNPGFGAYSYGAGKAAATSSNYNDKADATHGADKHDIGDESLTHLKGKDHLDPPANMQPVLDAFKAHLDVVAAGYNATAHEGGNTGGRGEVLGHDMANATGAFQAHFKGLFLPSITPSSPKEADSAGEGSKNVNIGPHTFNAGMEGAKDLKDVALPQQKEAAVAPGAASPAISEVDETTDSFHGGDTPAASTTYSDDEEDNINPIDGLVGRPSLKYGMYRVLLDTDVRRLLTKKLEEQMQEWEKGGPEGKERKMLARIEHLKNEMKYLSYENAKLKFQLSVIQGGNINACASSTSCGPCANRPYHP